MQAQGSVKNAKEDTVYYADVSLGDLWNDQSQFGIDLLEDTTAYESPSSRTGITGETGRELYLRFTYNSSNTNNILLIHASEADASDHTWLVGQDGSGEMFVSQNGTILWASSWGAGGDIDLSFSWCTRPNPLTTGASDEVISEIIAFKHDTNEYMQDHAQFTHSKSVTDPDWSFGLGGWYNGSFMEGGSTSPSKVRIGRDWHHSAEVAEDWLFQRETDPIDRQQNYPILPFPIELGGLDEWAGAANAGFAKRSAGLIQSTNNYQVVLNEVYPDPAWVHRAFLIAQTKPAVVLYGGLDLGWHFQAWDRLIQFTRGLAQPVADPTFAAMVNQTGDQVKMKIRINITAWVLPLQNPGTIKFRVIVKSHDLKDWDDFFADQAVTSVDWTLLDNVDHGNESSIGEWVESPEIPISFASNDIMVRTVEFWIDNQDDLLEGSIFRINAMNMRILYPNGWEVAA